MKKILLVVALFLSFSLSAQEHLEFRGIPIDGHLNIFVAKMKSIGYTIQEENNNVVIMKGKFTNKDVLLAVVGSVKTRTVWKVSVLFDVASSWSSLQSDYLEYKELFTNKYGMPKSYEFFSKPYYEGDGYELQALRNDKCTYASFFENSVGYISVRLRSSECLGLDYEDKVNSEISAKEKKSSALDEI